MDEYATYLSNLPRWQEHTKEYERELIGRAQAKDVAARNELIVSKLHMVVSVVKHFKPHRNDVLDMISEGNIGLFQAIERFDLRIDVRLSTYAYWYVRLWVYRFISKRYLIARPKHYAKVLRRIRYVTDTAMLETGYAPSLEEISELTGISLRMVTLALHSLKFDKPSSWVSNIVAPAVTDGDDADVAVMAARLVADAWCCVDSRTATIIKMRYGLGDYSRTHTLSEVGSTLGITKERVRQLQARGMEALYKKLRVEVGRDLGLDLRCSSDGVPLPSGVPERRCESQVVG